MDHGRAPLLDALAEYHQLGRYGFTPPDHRQGRGADTRTRAILGLDACPNPRDWSSTIGRVAAEQITPYPPGIPAIVPGERISAEVVDYLRSGLRAGMVCPTRLSRHSRRSGSPPWATPGLNSNAGAGY